MISEKGVTVQIGDVYIYGDKLESVKIEQKLSEASIELPIGTCEIVAKNINEYLFLFTSKQKIKVYYDGKIKTVVFVTQIKEVEPNKWNINCEDWVGFLEDTTWYGDNYQSRNAVDLLNYAFQKAGVPVVIDESFIGQTVSGDIDIVTCREAVLQICFAIGAVVFVNDFTDNDDESVKIKQLNKTVKQRIPANRIKAPFTIKTDEEVSSVGIETFGKRETTGVDDILINNYYQKEGDFFEFYFAEPCVFFEYQDQKGPFPLSKTWNAVEEMTAFSLKLLFKADNKKYKTAITAQKLGQHSKKLHVKNNPNASGLTEKKDIRITTAGLVNEENIETVFGYVFDILKKDKPVSCSIVEGKHVQEGDFYKYGEAKYGAIKYGERKPSIITYDEQINLGDVVELDTPDYGVLTRTVTEQRYALNSNIIVKECTLQ